MFLKCATWRGFLSSAIALFIFSGLAAPSMPRCGRGSPGASITSSFQFRTRPIRRRICETWAAWLPAYGWNASSSSSKAARIRKLAFNNFSRSSRIRLRPSITSWLTPQEFGEQFGPLRRM